MKSKSSFEIVLVTILLLTIFSACKKSEEITSDGRLATYQPDIKATQSSSATLESPPIQPGQFPTNASLCADPQPPFITDFNVYQAPVKAEPMARIPFRDPVYGICLVRVTDRKADLAVDDPSKGLKNEYSRVQAFNADESRMLVRGLAGTWYVYDTQTLLPIIQVSMNADPRWDAVNPYLIYYAEDTRLMVFDLTNQQANVVHEFAADFPGQNLTMVWTRYEGSPSVDSRYWGLMAENQDWMTVAFLIYDQVQDLVIAKRQVDPAEVDSVTISPLGNYFLAYNDTYCEVGQAGSDASPCGLMVYDRQLQNGRSLLRIIGHSDVALDSSGHEVLVYQDIDTDSLSMLDLVTGAITPLWSIDFSSTALGLHISGQSFARPGWVVISTHDGDVASHTWMDDQIFAMELKQGGKVVHLAHTHSLVGVNQEHDYWAEPQASANHDLTRVLFTSNWGRSGTEEVEMYMIDLPQDWVEGSEGGSTVLQPTLEPTDELAVSVTATQTVLAEPTSQVVQPSEGTFNPNPPASPVKLVFIHHSSGENWLNDENGGLGLALMQNNYFVSDTNYGWGPNTIGDRTDIGNWWEWFVGPDRDRTMKAVFNESGQNSGYTRLENDPGGENSIILFKSCFPNSSMEGSPEDPPITGNNPLRGESSGSEYQTVGNIKGIYNDLLGYFQTRPDKLFILITAPPLGKFETDTHQADNARAVNRWLVEDWLQGYPLKNVAVFDFYNVLTSNSRNVATNDIGSEKGNHHRFWNGEIQYISDHGSNFSAYAENGDSHPTAAGNQKATAEFLSLLNIFYHWWLVGQ